MADVKAGRGRKNERAKIPNINGHLGLCGQRPLKTGGGDRYTPGNG